MKKFFSAGFLYVLFTALLFAGGIENKTNMSTGYLRNPSRNAETKRPEAAFYNIAGTAFMEDGFYLEVGNQFIIKEYRNSTDDTALCTLLDKTEAEYSERTKVLLYPDFDLVFHHKDFSGFLAAGVFAGGGELNYNNGTALTAALFANQAMANPVAATLLLGAAKDHSLFVDSVTYGGQVGAAYKFLNDRIALAAAFRAVYGTQSMELTSSYLSALNGGDTIGYDADAWGYGAVFGLHVRPLEKVDISLQYQTRDKIEYEAKNSKGNLAAAFGIKDGVKFRTDLPAVLSFGTALSFDLPLVISFSYNYYFNTDAHQDSILAETKYEDSAEIALGIDYRFDKKFSAGFGISYADQGESDSENSAFNPVLDSLCIGAGVEASPIEQLTITAAFMWVKYFDADYTVSTVEFNLEKDLFMFSAGATLKL